MPQVSLETFVQQVRAGAAIASFPTDTVPALAVHPDQSALIFAAKQRQPDKPLILMGATADDLWDYVTGTPAERELWAQVAAKYWPGALTLVLPASDRVPRAMNPKDPTTIGVRVPAAAIARAILAQTGPLATTSANRSGQPPLTTLAAIAAQFPQVLTLHPTDLAQLAGTTAEAETPAASGLPSTVVRWRADGWEVLRQGAIVLSDE